MHFIHGLTFIIEKIREYSEYIVIDRYGDHAALKTDDDSDIFRDYRNPRYANIIGLNIMAKKGL
ncbi:hypothetical protein FACS1894188_03540 [Clostridia bacterium]|nr:hypothetical protein FACS1894188_03540 [Clostridia bacterium]